MKPKPIGWDILSASACLPIPLYFCACMRALLCSCVCACCGGYIFVRVQLASLSFIHHCVQLQLSGGVYLIGGLKGGDIHKLDEMI
jgi:hypothetical protein